MMPVEALESSAALTAVVLAFAGLVLGLAWVLGTVMRHVRKGKRRI